MPIIAMFYGIVIRLYLIDKKHHNMPPWPNEQDIAPETLLAEMTPCEAMSD